jgi:hypothetical protein
LWSVLLWSSSQYYFRLILVPEFNHLQFWGVRTPLRLSDFLV